jgi:hypothetical protein
MRFSRAVERQRIWGQDLSNGSRRRACYRASVRCVFYMKFSGWAVEGRQ